MIMLNPNKGRVTTIVASIMKKKGVGGQNGNEPAGEMYEEEERPESDAMAAKMAAMDSLAVAMEKRDAKGMVRAMQTFLEVCEYGEPEEKEEDDGNERREDSPAYSSPQYGSQKQGY
jgi:hypothetical protein